MNIILDYQIFYLQRYGGISRYYVELAKGILRNDSKNQMLIISPLYINNYLEELSKNLEVFGKKIHCILEILLVFGRIAYQHQKPNFYIVLVCHFNTKI